EPGHDLALGGGRRGPVPRVVPHGVVRLGAQVEGRQHDVGAVDGVVVAAGAERREGVHAGVAGRAVAAVVADGGGVGEGHVEAGAPGDRHGDLGHLGGVGEPAADVVV